MIVKNLKLGTELDTLYVNHEKFNTAISGCIELSDILSVYDGSSDKLVQNDAIEQYLSANYVQKVSESDDGKVGTIGIDYIKIRDLDSNLYRWMAISTDWSVAGGQLVWLDICPETDKLPEDIEGVLYASTGTVIEGDLSVASI